MTATQKELMALLENMKPADLSVEVVHQMQRRLEELEIETDHQKLAEDIQRHADVIRDMGETLDKYKIPAIKYLATYPKLRMKLLMSQRRKLVSKEHPLNERKTALPKYRHPTDPNKTWMGFGNKPKWFREYEKEGGDTEALLIVRNKD